MVPGSAASGLVAPISLRADATTPLPSHTCSAKQVPPCVQSQVQLSAVRRRPTALQLWAADARTMATTGPEVM